MKTKLFLAALTMAALSPVTSYACEVCTDTKHTHKRNVHAPIGVMGDHMHKKGEVMFSYRFMRMDMEGNRNGTNSLSPAQVIGFPNPNAPPANLRVVPTEMTMDMHMFGAMYGVNDWLTLMGMAMYKENRMKHLTFNMGGANIGGFTTESRGFGDTKLSGMFRIYEDDMHHVHLNAGLSLPTGSITKSDRVFTPMSTTPTLRLPYTMQLGTGTFDALPGITYTGETSKWNWGAQYRAEVRLEDENDEGYAWGNKHMITSWAGYQWNDWLNTNARLSFESMSEIDGRDPNITAPVQTADPDNYGGEVASVGIGFDITPPNWERQYFSVEATVPVYQDLNGPQMERNFNITAGYTLTF